MSIATIENLQMIVNDENRTEEERKEAAELILKLQGKINDSVPGIEEISDDDPEVQKIVNTKCHDPENCSGRLHLLWGPLPLQKAKERVAFNRRLKALKAKKAAQNSTSEVAKIAQELEATDRQWNEWVRRTLNQLGLPSL